MQWRDSGSPRRATDEGQLPDTCRVGSAFLMISLLKTGVWLGTHTTWVYLALLVTGGVTMGKSFAQD